MSAIARRRETRTALTLLILSSVLVTSSPLAAHGATGDTADEIVFYRDDGLHRYYDIKPDGNIGSPIRGGDGYTKNWSAITAVDLDGDGQDEILFYRNDGLFRYYNVNPNGTIGSPIRSGEGYTKDWSAITAIDLDGDGQDEILFYRNDGLFRYYNVNPNGSLGSPILAGNGYSNGWSSISAVDLDGDGQDEILFYRNDGLFRYYNVNPNGTIGSPIRSGDGYTKDWSAITAVDLDGQGLDPNGVHRKSGPVVISRARGRVIQGLSISNPNGACVRIQASTDVVIRNSVIGPCGGRAIEIVDSNGVTVEGVSVRNTAAGVYAVKSTRISVVGNSFSNAGRNFVQFDKVTGPGNRISANTGANKLGASTAEDLVSIYKSGGTTSSPLQVTDNVLRNGGPSSSGSGILVGDGGGSHIVVQGNTLADTGQVGIGVAGGSHIRVLGNVITSGAHSWSNVGLYVWNQGGLACSNVEVRDNRVTWRSADGRYNPTWVAGSCGTIAGWGDNHFTD